MVAVGRRAILFICSTAYAFLGLCRRRSRRVERVALGAIALASLGAASVLAITSPPTAFYLLPFRAWELLAGSLVGIGAIKPWRSSLVASLSAAIGIALIIATVVFLDGRIPFPGLAAVPPVFGAAMIIHAGLSHPASLPARLLGFAPIRWVGLWSYSIYLWHWPLLIFYPFVLGEMTTIAKIGLIAASIVMGGLSWAIVEQPFRNPGVMSNRPRTLGIFAGTMAALAGLVLITPIVMATVKPVSPTAQAYLAQLEKTKANRRGSCFINNDEFTVKKFDSAGCFAIDPQLHNVLLFGDSHAAHYYDALATVPGIHVLQATLTGCSPVETQRTLRGCEAMKSVVRSRILGSHPMVDTVILASRWSDVSPRPLRREVDRLTNQGFKVIIIGPVPEYSQALPRILAEAVDDPTVLPSDYLTKRPLLVEAALVKALKGSPARYVSVLDAICRDECPTALPGGYAMQFDYGHLTTQGAMVVINKTGLTQLLTDPELISHNTYPTS